MTSLVGVQNQNFTGDTSNDIHSPGPVIWEVSREVNLATSSSAQR